MSILCHPPISAFVCVHLNECVVVTFLFDWTMYSSTICHFGKVIILLNWSSFSLSFFCFPIWSPAWDWQCIVMAFRVHMRWVSNTILELIQFVHKAFELLWTNWITAFKIFLRILAGMLSIWCFQNKTFCFLRCTIHLHTPSALNCNWTLEVTVNTHSKFCSVSQWSRGHAFRCLINETILYSPSAFTEIIKYLFLMTWFCLALALGSDCTIRRLPQYLLHACIHRRGASL